MNFINEKLDQLNSEIYSGNSVKQKRALDATKTSILVNRIAIVASIALAAVGLLSLPGFVAASLILLGVTVSILSYDAQAISKTAQEILESFSLNTFGVTQDLTDASRRNTLVKDTLVLKHFVI